MVLTYIQVLGPQVSGVQSYKDITIVEGLPWGFDVHVELIKCHVINPKMVHGDKTKRKHAKVM